MSRPLRLLVAIAGIVVISVPLAILATIVLWSFWRWFEETTGIESFGHSGPAEWCYVLTFGLFVRAGSIWVALRARK